MGEGGVGVREGGRGGGEGGENQNANLTPITTLKPYLHLVDIKL